MSIELRMSMLVHEDTQWNAENQGQPGMDATGTAQLQASLISAQSSVSGCFDDDRWYPINARYEIISIHLPL